MTIEADGSGWVERWSADAAHVDAEPRVGAVDVMRGRTVPRSLLPPLGVAVAAGVGCIALAVWNPDDNGTPICPTKAIFNFDCPLCGGTRAVARLGRGDLAGAADHNLLVVLLLPVIIWWWARWAWSCWKGTESPPSPLWNKRAAATLAVVALVFSVVRNVRPGTFGNWLAADAS